MQRGASEFLGSARILLDHESSALRRVQRPRSAQSLRNDAAQLGSSLTSHFPDAVEKTCDAFHFYIPEKTEHRSTAISHRKTGEIEQAVESITQIRTGCDRHANFG